VAFSLENYKKINWRGKNMTTIEKAKNSMTKAPRSLAEMAKKKSEEKIGFLLICDCSGSMKSADAPGRKRRIDVLRAAISEMAGDIKIIAFADFAKIVHDLPEPSGDTCVAAAIQIAAVLRQNRHVILLSDGEPSDEEAALKEAARFGQPISTIFCGPEGGPGEDFLRRLAAATGGKFGELQAEKLEPRRLSAAIKALSA
jgi:Mg-chelatase subunit ChlD